LFAGCIFDIVPVRSITDVPTHIGDQNPRTLDAVVNPLHATNKRITWTSIDPKVATVTQNGLVTALSAGYTSIWATAQDDNSIAWCSIIVYPANYFGDWDFIVKRYWRDWEEIGGWNSDTVYYLGKISIGSRFNNILVEFMENKEFDMEMWLDSDQNFELYWRRAHSQYEKAFGKFEGNNKVYIEHGFYFYDNYHGTQDTTLLHTIIGTKRTETK